MSNFVFNCMLFTLFIAGISCQNVQVEIPQGILSGGTRNNVDGGTYYIFKNVPYGKPPTGELRFKASELADGWDGVRDATQDSPQCNSQEDCLFLNIYTPGLQSEGVSDLPVMFRIHGGGFTGGGSGEMNYGGGFLMTKDIVFVSINYRLGSLGFMSLDDADLGMTGNAALKDQVLALQWVQENIEYFGGNPDDVTLTGESAGSMCTHYHVLSSMSSGLFQKALSESGTAFTPDAISYIRNSAVIVAEYLGIQTDDWEAMVESLQSVDVSEIRAAESALESDYPYMFRPIVEVASSESFIEKWPIEIIESGEFNQVPYLNGVNNMDGSGPVSNIADFIPPDLQIESGSEAEQDIVQRIEDFYYGEGVSWGSLSAGAVLDTDYQFLYPHYRAVRGQAASTGQSIFLYYFTSVTGLNSGPGGGQGAGHGAELGYLFFNTQNSQNTAPESGSVEDLAWRNMVDLWTNFMIYGNPTPSGFDYIWEEFESDAHNYLEIATDGSYPLVRLLQANMDFWDAIYADYYTGLPQIN